MHIDYCIDFKNGVVGSISKNLKAIRLLGVIPPHQKCWHMSSIPSAYIQWILINPHQKCCHMCFVGIGFVGKGNLIERVIEIDVENSFWKSFVVELVNHLGANSRTHLVEFHTEYVNSILVFGFGCW